MGAALLAVLAAFATVPAGAQDEPAAEETTPTASPAEERRIAELVRDKVAPGWSTHRTRNFLIVHDDDVDARTVERLARELQALRDDVLAVRFPSERAWVRITVARVCESRRQYMAIGGRGSHAGYYSRHHREIVCYADRNDKRDVVRVARAVSVEAYLDDALPRAEAHSWFSVGLGEVYAGARFVAGSFRVEPFRWRTATAAEWKTRWSAGLRPEAAEGEAPHAPLDLATWLAWSEQEFTGRNELRMSGGACAALAWSLMYFLVTSEDATHRGVLERYYRSLVASAYEGGKPDPAAWREAALKAALEDIDVAALERDWLAHTWD